MGATMTQKKMLTINEVAEILRLDKSTIYNLVNLPVDNPNRLPAYKILGSYRIAEDELNEYIRQSATGNQ